MTYLKIVGLCVAASIVYGIVHDNVTARVCVEYFTIGHPKIIESQTPTALAFAWGVVATWWVGLILSFPLTLAAQAGPRPKLSPSALVRPINVLLLVMAATSLLAGITGYFAARSGLVWLEEPLASDVPREAHVRFLADLWAHLAAYGTGFFGGIAVCILTWKKRGQMGSQASEARVISG